MKRFWIGCLGFLALGTVPFDAGASVFRYTYDGSVLTTPDDFAASGLPATIPAFDGVMTIDEDLLPGGTLRNATIDFFAAFGFDTVGSFTGVDATSAQLDGLLEYTFASSVVPFPATAYTDISFTTDGERRITSWRIDMLDGPPDAFSSDTLGDIYDVFGDVTYSASPGTWTVAVVPVPASLLLLVTALGAIAGIRRRPAGP